MNSNNLRLVADALEAQELSPVFDMGTWVSDTPCGTAACIGGTADMVLHPLGNLGWPDVAGKLGLNFDQARYLFECECSDPDWCADMVMITREAAIIQLRHAAEYDQFLNWNDLVGDDPTHVIQLEGSRFVEYHPAKREYFLKETLPSGMVVTLKRQHTVGEDPTDFTEMEGLYE